MATSAATSTPTYAWFPNSVRERFPETLFRELVTPHRHPPSTHLVVNSKRSFAKPRSETGVSDRTRLLLSIDPLAALAESQSQLHDRLLEMTPHPYPDLQAAWHDAATAGFATEAPPGRVECSKEQVLILVTFRDEKLQVELLGRFATEALTCKALLS